MVGRAPNLQACRADGPEAQPAHMMGTHDIKTGQWVKTGGLPR